MWAAAALVAVLSATVPGAAPKHAKAKLPGVTVTTQAKAQDFHLADLASARHELCQWACVKDAYIFSLPCQNVKFAKELWKVKDPAQKNLMIQKHHIETSISSAQLDEAWSAAKEMYTAFCARSDLPAGSKVCTSVTLKTTYTAPTRASHWVLSAAPPAAAPKHAKPKAGLPGITPQVKMQDPNLEDLASARRELHQWACARADYSASLPCRNVKFAKELSKIKDPAQKTLMIQKQQIETTSGSPEAKVARLDKAWSSTKEMYTAFCSRSDMPAGSKVCTNMTLKNTYTHPTRPSHWGMQGKPTAAEHAGAHQSVASARRAGAHSEGSKDSLLPTMVEVTPTITRNCLP